MVPMDSLNSHSFPIRPRTWHAYRPSPLRRNRSHVRTSLACRLSRHPPYRRTRVNGQRLAPLHIQYANDAHARQYASRAVYPATDYVQYYLQYRTQRAACRLPAIYNLRMQYQRVYVHTCNYYLQCLHAMPTCSLYRPHRRAAAQPCLAMTPTPC